MKDIKALLAQMTLEEKIGQLIQLSADFFGTEAELTGPAQSWGLTEEQLAMVGSCIGGKSAAEIRRIQENHLKKDRNKIPLLFARDVIHGYRTIYPIGLAMAGSFDPALMTECTEMAAKEAAAGGTHLTYAPMVDLARDARCGRVMESCGEDPLLGVTLTARSKVDHCAHHPNHFVCAYKGNRFVSSNSFSKFWLSSSVSTFFLF